MSDTYRKDMSTKAGEMFTPNSSKSTGDKVMESVTNTGDKFAREAQPDSEKGAGQRMADTFGRNKDNNSGRGGVAEDMMNTAKNTLGMGDKK